MTTLIGDAAVDSRVRTARVTGLLYLALVPGGIGFLVVRPRLYDADAPTTTLANLLAHEGMARLGVALELWLVVMQVLAALWFFKLFRPVDSLAAGALAAFGFMNAVALMGSAAWLGTAVQAAHGPGTVSDDPASTVQLAYVVSGNLWQVGALFFGAWLVPMGMLVVKSGWMPRPLGWVLVVGGAGYVVSSFAFFLLPSSSGVPDLLTIPASVAEFWMIGYLLVRGVRATP